jgi:rhodanese-related sulfurtransferase
VSAEELRRWQADADKPLVLLDVRESGAYSAGTIPGAQSLPQGSLFLDMQKMMPQVTAVAEQAATAEVVLFANTGGTDGAAASRDLYVLNVLVELGGVSVDRIVRLQGGLNAWTAAGHKTVQPPKPLAAASLEALLDEAELTHLAEPLQALSLEQLTDEFTAGGRPQLLETLKSLGLKLPDRQKLASAVSRTVKRAGGEST